MACRAATFSRAIPITASVTRPAASCARPGFSPERMRVTFQSRFGNEEWLKPYTDETVQTLAKSGVKRMAIVAPGFTADCLETLEETRTARTATIRREWRRAVRLHSLPQRHRSWHARDRERGAAGIAGVAVGPGASSPTAIARAVTAAPMAPASPQTVRQPGRPAVADAGDDDLGRDEELGAAPTSCASVIDAPRNSRVRVRTVSWSSITAGRR